MQFQSNRALLTEAEIVIERLEAFDDVVFNRLIQYYEAEFSGITKKVPNSLGLFDLDTPFDQEHVTYLLFVDGAPGGFNVIHVKGNNNFEVKEFYVLPVFRKERLGRRLAAEVFDRHRGSWEVKQIQGADVAKEFWRKTIGHYTQGNFKEDTYKDPYWGYVNRQQVHN